MTQHLDRQQGAANEIPSDSMRRFGAHGVFNEFELQTRSGSALTAPRDTDTTHSATGSSSKFGAPAITHTPHHLTSVILF